MSPEERKVIERLIGLYLNAWSEMDRPTRISLLERVWRVDSLYIDPRNEAYGRGDLDDLIGAFLAANPGATFTLQGPIDYHHDHIRFYWTLRQADGTELAGMDYGELSPDGRLAKIIGFY